MVTKLITSDQVVAILGEVASSRSLAAAPVAQQNGIPMISPSSTNPKVTEVGDYIFRVCFIDPFQGLVMAKFAANTLKVKNVAILRDIKNDYSVGLADVFIENFKKMGGTIVADESYSEGDTDFSAQLTSIKAKNPAGHLRSRLLHRGRPDRAPGQEARPHRSAAGRRRLGFAQADRDRRRSDLNGSYFSNHYSVEDPSPAIQKFVADYKARYGEIPDALAGLGIRRGERSCSTPSAAPNSTEAGEGSRRDRADQGFPGRDRERSRSMRTATPSSPPSSCRSRTESLQYVETINPLR